MLVFVDESGDAGLRLEKGSSDVFVITLVLFENVEAAHSAEAEIKLLRSEMGLHPAFEFKFNKLNSARRKRVLRRFAEFDFAYHSVVIKKRELDLTQYSRPESFYKYTCRLAFEATKELLTEAIVVIDGSGSKEFRQEFQKYIKDGVNERSQRRSIAKVKISDSSKNDLLQVADMICGAISRSYKDKPDKLEYREEIKNREGSVENWPK